MILFIVWAFLNSLAWGYGSTAALPFATVLFILMLCLLVYFPLTLIGGLTGRMRSKDVVPYIDEKYAKIPKEIPQTKWFFFLFLRIYFKMRDRYKSIYMHIFLSGLLPFRFKNQKLSFIYLFE